MPFLGGMGGVFGADDVVAGGAEMYLCENLCGFSGGYQEVAMHEESCAWKGGN